MAAGGADEDGGRASHRALTIGAGADGFAPPADTGDVGAARPVLSRGHGVERLRDVRDEVADVLAARR